MAQPRYRPEPAFTHAPPARCAVLYCNLGTPDAPTAAALRRYLAEFLSDPRVVELPRVPWWLLLHGVILRRRPASSAAKYARIWTPEGSPLRLWTDRQALLLQGWLAQRTHPVPVRAAMRYGSGAIAEQLDALTAQGATRILVLPAYPQYSATTTASVFDAVYAWAARTRHVPELRFVNDYHDAPEYIEALVKHIRREWQTHGRGDKLVMSFHGIPQRSVQRGDPYHAQCLATARLLARRLGLAKDDYLVSFQSRLGRARWLEPYTAPTLVELARSGVARVDVVCPGFTSDCLETLEEIAIEGRAAFLGAGGKELHYIGCLNDQPEWIGALCTLALQHMQGWPTQAPGDAHSTAPVPEHARTPGA